MLLLCFMIYVVCSGCTQASPFESTKSLPVAYQGRIRPLDSAARSWLQESSIEAGDSPLQLLWSTHFAEHVDVEQELNGEIAALALQMSPASSSKQIAHMLHTQFPLAKRLISAGKTLPMLPTRLANHEWVSLHALALKVYDPERSAMVQVQNFTPFSDALFEQLRAAYLSLSSAMQAHQFEAAASDAAHFAQVYQLAYTSLPHSSYPSGWLLELETAYTQLPLIELPIIFYTLSLLLLVVRQLRLASTLCLLTGYFVHTAILIMRCLILGRPPVANMFETLLYVPWMALTLGLLCSSLMRSRLVLTAATLASLLLLIVLRLAYADPHLENVQAVLNSAYWLTIHVLMVVGSYGAFALAGILGHYYLFTRAFLYQKIEPRTLAGRSILYTMYAGVSLLIPGTILGGVWAAESWGRFWDWDPKESWAFISASLYLLIIHAYRFQKINEFGLALGAVWGLMSISFTWYGVNYILGTGLHSYGFGSGGEWIYFSFLAAELLFTGAAIYSWQWAKRYQGQ